MARRPYSSGGADARDIQSLVNAFLQLDPRARVIVVVLLAIAGVVALAFYERNIHQQSSAAVANPNLLLGNPSGATADPFNRSNYLLNKPYFAIGYNADNGTPNWVSWRVTSDDLGHAPRKQLFEADESLPSSFYHVTQHDYSGSGFDRGHMCPHGDRTANTDMSYATFVMTNVIPQAPNVNRKAWEQLESYSRELVERQHAHLYIMAGPCGRGGVGSEGPRETIGRGRVVVPAECWKIIVGRLQQRRRRRSCPHRPHHARDFGNHAQRQHASGRRMGRVSHQPRTDRAENRPALFRPRTNTGGRSAAAEGGSRANPPAGATPFQRLVRCHS
jgi:DNA/RNA endonuclease G (NUC1)